MGARLLSIIFAVIAIALGAILFIGFDTILLIFDNQRFTVLVGLGTIASAITAIIMGRSAVRTSQFEAIKQYYLNGDTPEMREARRKVYEYGEDSSIELDNSAASTICGYFHFWGILVEKKHLPIWVFESASGPSIVKLYTILEPYINEKRQNGNELYASHFEKLAKRIRKKYGYKVHIQENLNGKGDK